MFNSLAPDIVLQEVPNEVSLLFSITGCDVGCSGCHSTELWDAQYGTPLTEEKYLSYLTQYQNLVSCILFFGGEWQPIILTHYLKLAKKHGFKTCLYTGRDSISDELKDNLNFLKTGAYQKHLGGLNSLTTNQKFYDLTTNKLINHKFIKTYG
jgi:anaerobic ribonucleoside-triphosphate reductase activating protein